ncbi:hypothetical protein PAECIP111891_03186 [Paenibacillus allorhizoplanae]|uniref:VWFA domain-containing protein n=1 Tax=Paenibacillus allorhizoplanae TaxID=2905648 RepID=A0ABM9CBT1_9BACL|nr:VWA domain-containing protein [Paenibacillus allorhizoplanae]CAH1208268.1 hypothetical protein PAECIP111891_03186 [Paenibacillus allorhizoplanae]
MTNGPVLEGEIVKRTLQFFWLVDCSGSMEGQKIASLNRAIQDVIPQIQKAVSAHPEVQIMMRAIKFSNDASWHVGPNPIPLEKFVWPEVRANGVTATAQAINLLANELDIEKMNRRGYPPVCILLSDGFCTDPESEYEKAIQNLNSLPWGKRSVKLVIAIGKDREYDEEQLLKFVSHQEIGVLKADTPEKLIAYIQWASITASIGASVGKSKAGDPANDQHNVALASPPQVQVASSSTDVF